MPVEVQHIAATVIKPVETARFYSCALGFPLVSVNLVRGREFDEMYGLDGVVNFIGWHQFPDSALELFYLPRHPPGNEPLGDLTRPGYSYAGYRVAGLDVIAARLERAGARFRIAAGGGRRALLVRDPSWVNVLLFEDGECGAGSYCLGVAEVGLTVSSPDEYGRFFDVIGLAKRKGRDAEFEGLLGELFESSAPVETCLFGHIRLIHFPDGQRASAGAGRAFNELGVRHVAYIVGDADAFYGHASGEGVRFIFEPRRVPGGSLISYFLDPEGNTMEIVEPEPGAAMAQKLLGAICAGGAAAFSRLGLRL